MEVLFVVGGILVAAIVAWLWTRYELRVRKQIAIQRGKDYMTDFMAQQGYKVGEPWPTQTVQLPSIPIEPLPIPEASHLPTWTPTVSHFPDQDHGPETTSQHDFDAISDNGSHDDGCCDGGDDGSD